MNGIKECGWCVKHDATVCMYYVTQHVRQDVAAQSVAFSIADADVMHKYIIRVPFSTGRVQLSGVSHVVLS